MARKTEDITIDANNRDHGKRFRITEMDAYSAEFWARKAIHGIASAGVDLPTEVLGAETAEALASVGLSAFLKIDFDLQQELADQLMDCVQLIYNNNGGVRNLLKNDIEEPSTLFMLKLKVLQLHLGSFFTGGSSNTAA